MLINPGNVLTLLLLLSVAGGVPSAAGQNTFLNNSGSDISNLIGNVTKGVTEGHGGDQSSSFPPVNEDGNVTKGVTEGHGGDQSSSFPFIGNVTDFKENLIGNVTKGVTEGHGGDQSSNFPPVNESSNGVSSDVTTSRDVMINEVELNPPGNDQGKQWIELYNPTKVDVNIGNFEIITSSKLATIKLPPSAVIEAGKTYVVDANQQMLPHSVESLILIDATGNIKDRTPSLVDRSDDDHTWQRIPDGNNEWQFVEGTRDNLNGPNSSTTRFDNSYSGPNTKCLGSAVCTEGIAIRIVDGDTLYVIAGSTIYKVDLALINTPSRNEKGFVEATQFTRDLCLGSTVLIDQDDRQLTTNSSIIGVVYCSSNNLNSELLDNGYATLDVQQCATSEFAQEPWAKNHGC
jgi:endonuclease YncB( thermonuclease family)